MGVHVGAIEATVFTESARDPADGPDRATYLAPHAPVVAKYSVPIHTLLAREVLAVWYQPKGRLQDLDGFELIDVQLLDHLHVALTLSAATTQPKRTQIRILVLFEEERRSD